MQNHTRPPAVASPWSPEFSARPPGNSWKEREEQDEPFKTQDGAAVLGPLEEAALPLFGGLAVGGARDSRPSPLPSLHLLDVASRGSYFLIYILNANFKIII